MTETVQQDLAVDYDPFAGGAVQKVVPTTEAQREVFLAHQLGVDASLAYNESVSLIWQGELDVPVLISALQDLLQRHEALRGKFGADGTDLWIGSETALPVQLIDLSSEVGAGVEAAVSAQRLISVETPFDLVDGPMFRAVLLSFGSRHFELILSAHHIVCDGWSFGVLARDLVKCYQARLNNADPDLEAPHAFSDYAFTLTQVEAQEKHNADLNFWMKRFESSVPILDLPCDFPRRPMRSFASRREDLLIPSQVVKAIRQIGAQQGASLFAVLFGVFSALIGRLSRQDDVVVGVAAAGQSTLENPNLVGHCVNLLPVRVQMNQLDGLTEVIQHASRSVMDAYEHQDCTFGSLLQKLHLARDPSRLTLVSVLFNLDRAITSAELSSDDLKIELRSNARSFENFELFLNISQIDDGLVLECQYQTDLFESETVRRWLELYSLALQRLAGQPTVTVASAFAPSLADLAILNSLNATEMARDRSVRVDTLIALQSRATPDAAAVRCGKTTLSYRELEERSNAVAKSLQARGFGPGDLIGLACGRNEHMLVGLYGILKSGAGYVPMDPDFPTERLTFMATDADLRLVVTDSSRVTPWKFGTARSMVVDAPETYLPQSDSLSPTTAVRKMPSAEDVAYVIYTSGSTGRPKGVRVTHANVANLLASFTRVLGLQPSDRALSVTTLSFDIAVMEVILPLTFGAMVVISDRDQAKDGDRLRDLIESERVSFINATPSTWRLLLDAGWSGRKDLCALCGGEAFPADLAEALQPAVGSLWNVYGPTETTVWSSLHRVEKLSPTIPIGRPIGNTQFYVLDGERQRLPVGVTGELYIGGEGVTAGYLNRDELTAERFVADPLLSPSGRIYRTGDLGRVRNDGLLECAGRADHQVKVRGYRIELGEIEAVLADYPQVAQVIVMAREDRPNDVRIVAYLVASGEMPTPEALRSHAGLRLPEYMIPQHFMPLSAMPLLPNGKVDRRALPAPEIIKASDASNYVAPRDDLERAVLTAMEDILNLPGLGVTGDFFALGGHSLLAARLISRLNRDFGARLPLRSVFESPTAERLSALLKAGQAGEHFERPPIVALPGRQSAPLTPMQARIRFVEELHPGNVLYNTPSAHRLRGPFDYALFAEALRLLVQRQPSLRTVIQADAAGDDYEQHVLSQCIFDLPLIDLESVPAAMREATLMRELQTATDTPLNLYEAPLFRSAVYRLAVDQHVFFFMPHHIVWDGWSFDLLYEELGSIYEALVSGKALSLPPLPLSYGDYAEWFARWLEGPEAVSQLAYWNDHFAKAPAVKAINPDFPRGSGMTGTGASEWIKIDPSLTGRLHEVGNRAQATVNMLTMAVYAALMASAIDSTTIVIGIPVRGRAMGEVESVMGFFNNLLPLVLQVDENLSFLEFLGVVRHELLDVFGYQEIPFELIAQQPQVRSRTQGTGVYQALFSFQDARERKRAWGPLRQENIPLLQKGATEDFGLWLMEGPFGLEGGITYNADLFSQATAVAVRERYTELLKRVADNPDIRLGALMNVELSQSGTYLRRLSAASADPAPVRKERQRSTLSSAESALAGIWAGLLDLTVSDISPEDNFFDLGGDSLRAMRAVDLAAKKLNLHIDARRYLHESLATLAATPASVGVGEGKTRKAGSLFRKLFGGRA
jgi:amino acid adenylation domain-containing protein